MKWCMLGSSAVCFVLFALFLTSLIFFLIFRSKPADYDKDLARCPEADVSAGDAILADTNAVVVMEQYAFILNDALLLKPCGDSGKKFDVVFQGTKSNLDVLIAKFEKTGYDSDKELMDEGKIYDCQGDYSYLVTIEAEELVTETSSTSVNSEGTEVVTTHSESEWVMKVIYVYYSDETTLAAVFEIDDSRESAQLYADDQETVLASFERLSETEADFLIDFGDTDTSEYDTALVYLAFGVWAFTDEIGAYDLCFVIKYFTICGTVTFGVLFVLVVCLSCALRTRRSPLKIKRI